MAKSGRLALALSEQAQDSVRTIMREHFQPTGRKFAVRRDDSRGSRSDSSGGSVVEHPEITPLSALSRSARRAIVEARRSAA
jgi:hypothetical protein